MAYSSAELSADEIAWMAADKPLALGQNHLRDASSIEWSATAGGASLNWALYPTTRLHDGYTDLLSIPSSTGNWRYLCCDFGSPGVDVDCVAILGHYLNTDGFSRITVSIANDAAHTSNQVTVLDDSSLPSDDQRLVYLDLHHTGSNPRRYSSVRYLYVAFYDAVSDDPRIGEILIGRRRQFKTNPFEPWDPSHLANHQRTTVALSGNKARYIFARGERRMSATYRVHETARVNDLLALWNDDTVHGQYPFLWVDEPTSNPNLGAYMVWDSNERTAPTSGPQERVFTFSASEQGPDYVELDG